MILEGRIAIPYKWTTGSVVGRFLGELKENARIVGARCDTCGKVYVPPPDVCGECYRPPSSWVPLSGEGTIIAVSRVEQTMPWSPYRAPYTLGLVRLDGAGTDLLHLVSPDVQPGCRVWAVFKETRHGSLLDIERFVMVAPAVTHDAGETGESEIETMSDVDSGGAPEVTRSAPAGSVDSVASVFGALPSRFRAGVAEQETSFYFSIDEHRWTVVISATGCIVEEGRTIETADCYLKTSAEIFLGAINRTYTPSMTDLMTGRVKSNNPFLLQKFIEVFG